MRYDAVLLDADGVLVEPTAHDTFAGAIQRALAEHGVDDPPAEALDGLRAVTPASLRETCAALGIEDVAGFWAARDHHGSAVQREAIRRGEKALYDDVAAVVDLPVPLAVVSNNQQATVDFLVEHAGLDGRFAAVVGRSPALADLERKKPAPDFLERVLADLDAERPLFVGDSEVDVAAAEAAGVDAAFLRRAHRADYALERDPTYEVATLEDVRDLVLEGDHPAADD